MYLCSILQNQYLLLFYSDKKKIESQLTTDENNNLVNDIKNAIINFLK